ncbi:MAG: hypothetical protein PHP22_03160 [Oscillospiraceae bacterium]|nr:hypothetical protein [Oscillospiraceae bacterium]
MAKFCFYCGQELAPGEKCKCRHTNGTVPPKEANRRSGGSSAQQTANSSKTGKSDPASGPKIRQSRKEKSARPSFRLRTFTDQLRTLFPTFSSGAMSFAGYLLRPATKIRQESLRAKRPFSIVTIAVFSVMTALLGVVLVYSGSHLFTGMMDSIFGRQAVEFCKNYPAPAFIAMALLALLFIMILTLGFYLTSRFGSRKPTFRKTLDLVSISLVYVQIPEIILLITILLGGRSSISFLFIGLILLGLAQLLAFRNALGLSEDNIFLMILGIYSMTYLIAKFLVFILISAFFPT